jgi:hypothetical protein
MGHKHEPITVEIERNVREVLRIATDEYQGQLTLDIRIWFRDRDALKPTKRGVGMALRHLPALAAGINEVLARAKAAGLVE